MPSATAVIMPILDVAPAYDVETLADLESVFGRLRVAALLAGLRGEIVDRLSRPAEGAQLGRDAHVLVSVSGTLGFMALSHACAELELCCMTGEGVAAALARTLTAADHAKQAIDGFGTTLQ